MQKAQGAYLHDMINKLEEYPTVTVAIKNTQGHPIPGSVSTGKYRLLELTGSVTEIRLSY